MVGCILQICQFWCNEVDGTEGLVDGFGGGCLEVGRFEIESPFRGY